MAHDLAVPMATAHMVRIAFDNSYARLPEHFYVRQPPVPVAAPRLVRINRSLAHQLELDPDALATTEGVEILAGNRLAAGSEPLAQAYAGHQFGGFSPRLGDGRAVLLGELIDRYGARRDIQLKGAGRTAFSRGGDGRAALGPVLREYLISEAMAALGIPTTRSLAAVATGEAVYRERALPGAVLVRVAASHIRVGTFQYFAARGDTDAVRRLADYVIARHYPATAGSGRPYHALLEQVMARHAALVAQWLLVGFIHGVMNTDNCAISGETIDYGPCAFMDAYDPATVFSSIDHQGRYAYANQPRIAAWNMARFAETLLPLLDTDADRAVAQATEILGTFSDLFTHQFQAGLRRKLGLLREQAGDAALAQDLLRVMKDGAADFTRTFRLLCDAATDIGAAAAIRALFQNPNAYDAWNQAWRARLAEDGPDEATRQTMMREANPAFIPRNHRVEAALAAAEGGDLGPFEELLAILDHPFADQPEHAAYMDPPAEAQPGYQTFCGT